MGDSLFSVLLQTFNRIKPRMETYTRIVSGELVIRSLDGANLAQVVTELCVRSKLEPCHFDVNKWFGLLTEILLYTHVKNEVIYCYEDYEKLRAETKWREYFSITTKTDSDGTHLVYYLSPRLESAPSVPEIFTPETFAFYCQTQESYFRYWRLFDGLKKHDRETLFQIRPYFFVFSNILENPNYIRDLTTISWKNKLTKFNKFLKEHENIWFKYFKRQTLKEDLILFSTLDKYVKQYGNVFYNILSKETSVDLTEPRLVRNLVYGYWLQNNRLLCEPLSELPKVTGGWKIKQLVTTLDCFEESEHQHNCLGKSGGSFYLKGVVNGNYLLFSFRLNNKRHTVCYERRGLNWIVGESKGYQNKNDYTPTENKTLEFNIELLRIHLNKYNKISEEDF